MRIRGSDDPFSLVAVRQAVAGGGGGGLIASWATRARLPGLPMVRHFTLEAILLYCTPTATHAAGTSNYGCQSISFILSELQSILEHAIQAVN